jgi:hypothetical protein
MLLTNPKNSLCVRRGTFAVSFFCIDDEFRGLGGIAVNDVRSASARSGCRRGRPHSSSRRRKTETEIRRRGAPPPGPASMPPRSSAPAASATKISQRTRPEERTTEMSAIRSTSFVNGAFNGAPRPARTASSPPPYRRGPRPRRTCHFRGDKK